MISGFSDDSKEKNMSAFDVLLGDEKDDEEDEDERDDKSTINASISSIRSVLESSSE
jgi:hypothetical protein